MAPHINWKLFGTAAENVEKQAAGMADMFSSAIKGTGAAMGAPARPSVQSKLGVPRVAALDIDNTPPPPSVKPIVVPPSTARVSDPVDPTSQQGRVLSSPSPTSPAAPAAQPAPGGGQFPPGGGITGPTSQSFIETLNRPLTHSEADGPNAYDGSPEGNSMAAAQGLDPSKPPMVGPQGLPGPVPGGPGTTPVNPGVPAPAAPGGGAAPAAPGGGYIPGDNPLPNKTPAPPPAPAEPPPGVSPEQAKTGPDGVEGTSDDDFWKKQKSWWSERPQRPKAPQSQQGGGFGPQIMQYIRSMFGPGGGGGGGGGRLPQYPGAWPGMTMPQWPGGGGGGWPGGGGGGWPQQQQQQQQPWNASREDIEAWMKNMPTRGGGAPAAPAAQAAPSNEPGATAPAPPTPPAASLAPAATTSMAETMGVQQPPSGRQPSGTRVPGAPEGPEGGRMEDMPKPVEPEGFGFRSEGQPPPEAPGPLDPGGEQHMPILADQDEKPEAPQAPAPSEYGEGYDPAWAEDTSPQPPIDPTQQYPLGRENQPIASLSDEQRGRRIDSAQDSRRRRGAIKNQREEEFGPNFPEEVADSYENQETPPGTYDRAEPSAAPASPPAPPKPRDLPRDQAQSGDLGAAMREMGESPDSREKPQGGRGGRTTMDYRPDEDAGGRTTMDYRPDEDAGGRQELGADPNQWNEQQWMDDLRKDQKRNPL